MARNRAFREAVYREYMEFFEKAERNRRWNVFNDIPWDDEVRPEVFSEDAALNAETFLGVEMYLPDYVGEGINIVRDNFGSAWFQANWGYEESKHALSIRKYLVHTGQRTEAEMFDYEEKILGLKWKPLFTTARQITLYGMIQEQATFMLYKHQHKLARDRGDHLLATIYQYISRDEAAHSDFYRKVVALELDEDREAVLNDLTFVFANFKMPGTALVPEYDDRIQVMRKTGDVDRKTFLRETWFPLLKKLGVTRRDLAKASAAQRAAAQTAS